MRMLLLAPPGAGKGTQGTALADHYGAAHISSGDLLRGEITSESALGRRVKGFLDAGDLVPDEVMEDLVREHVLVAAKAGGYVLDGFPRNVAQAERAHEWAAGRNISLQAVLFLVVADEELTRRLLGRNRGADDTEDTIRHRLEVYHRETEPLVARYRDLGLLHEVDGSGDPGAVTAAALAALADVVPDAAADGGNDASGVGPDMVVDVDEATAPSGSGTPAEPLPASPVTS